MKDQKYYEFLVAAFMFVVLGVELAGFSALHFYITSQNPYSIFNQASFFQVLLVLSEVLVVFLVVNIFYKRKCTLLCSGG